MTANAPIDFEKETAKAFWHQCDSECNMSCNLQNNLEKWARSIAERVEAQTIERMDDIIREKFDGNYDYSLEVPRLYGPKSDKEEGKHD